MKDFLRSSSEGRPLGRSVSNPVAPVYLHCSTLFQLLGSTAIRCLNNAFTAGTKLVDILPAWKA
ncbi:MAG: hypothetical protein DWI22_10495 [Planctomycetota bacterium]|nr:MAG: hypothetical protein DWI22_10495 [Planctomycetota bacterium]